jgi:outer membrane lipoprotein-sorting protein
MKAAHARISLIALLVALVAATAASADSGPEKWIDEAQAAYDRVTSYTAIFHKQQRVEGELLPEETILVKFRKPGSLYMKWIREPYGGSELIYVEGWNDNKVRAHRGGLLRLITRNLSPRDARLMKDNLRPVTDTGIGFLVAAVATHVRHAIAGEGLRFSEPSEQTLYGRRTQLLELSLPEADVTEHGGRKLLVYRDVESRLFIAIKVYDRRGQLVESYSYEDLDLDPRLTAADFDPKNPAYGFF